MEIVAISGDVVCCGEVVGVSVFSIMYSELQVILEIY